MRPLRDPARLRSALLHYLREGSGSRRDSASGSSIDASVPGPRAATHAPARHVVAGQWRRVTAVCSVVLVQPPTGTVTFLFTDIEGSTRRWQDEPDAMRVLLVEHDAILRDVIDKHGGLLFRHIDDGVAAVFASAGDAANAAVDAQERLRDVLPVRMGLHTGEAELRDGDYFGSTLNRWGLPRVWLTRWVESFQAA